MCRLIVRSDDGLLCQLMVRERIGMGALSVELLLWEFGVAAFFPMGLAVFFALLAFG